MREESEKLLQEGISAWQDKRETEALAALLKAQEAGNMKAGRYLALIYLQQAADRGDITSKVILGMLCEYGCGMEEDPEKAKEYYLSALKDNHRNREGFMLAAGADLGMGRLLSRENEKEKAAGHLEGAIEGGDPGTRLEAEFWLNEILSE